MPQYETASYRDMHLLDELSKSPAVTQRELSKRIGVALGLTNLMLRRLAKKGYIKITGTKRSRIRYLITPKGILEKSRLTYEFVQYSLHLYSRVRRSLRDQLSTLTRTPNRKIVLCGTGELAEIAFLTIQEMGLELVGVVEATPITERFLGHPVRTFSELSKKVFDRVIVASLDVNHAGLKELVALGVSPERLITLTEPGWRALSPEFVGVMSEASAVPAGETSPSPLEPIVSTEQPEKLAATR